MNCCSMITMTAALHSTLSTHHCKRATVESFPSCSWCPHEHQTSVWGPQTCSGPCLLRWWAQCHESWAQGKRWHLLPGGGGKEHRVGTALHYTTVWCVHYNAQNTCIWTNTTCNSIDTCVDTQHMYTHCKCESFTCHVYPDKKPTERPAWARSHLANEHLADLIVASRSSLHQRSQTSLPHSNGKTHKHTQGGIDSPATM